jgi:C-terminal processing protease CtpA/Prc
VEQWATDKMTSDFEVTLLALQKAGATTLLVDITQNGGGSEWTEAAARIVTGVPLVSERLGFVRGAHWVKKWSDLAANLRKATSAPQDHEQIMSLARQANDKARIAATGCSSEPYWKGERPPCQWLSDGAYATGLIGSAKTDDIKSKSWAPLVFAPAKYPYKDGVWRGPLIVVVDGDTWSAAEEFAAVLQDNRAALIVGVPTGGAGCGHTDGGTPTTLSHSHGVLKLPDCARLRASGDNEAAGVQPDLLIGLRRNDGANRQARFLKEKLPEAVRLATALKQ